MSDAGVNGSRVRRKVLYEEMHPETAAGKAGAAAKHGRENSATAKLAVAETPATKGFTANTAAKTGLSERTIRRDAATGEAIPDDVAKLLSGTPVGDNKGQLQQLAKLPESEQRKAAKAIAAGKAKTVKEAAGAKTATGKSGAVEKALAALGVLTRRLDDCNLYEKPCCKTGCTIASAIAFIKKTLGAMR